MITCHLTKLELALDQLKKSHPKLKPADAALLASALSITGRHALALYDGAQYVWPDDGETLDKAMVAEIHMAQEAAEPVAKKTKTSPEEEPVVLTLGLAPNLTAGEAMLNDRNDLKAKLSDLLQEGVEFLYANNDIGWQWHLDHVNWNTVSGGDLARRVKVKTTFTQGAVGVEMGTTTTKKRGKAKAVEAVAVVEEVVAPEEIEEIPALEAEMLAEDIAVEAVDDPTGV